jgi:hypothetical protein
LKKTNKLPWIFLVIALAGAVAAFVLLREEPEPPPVAAPVVTAKPEPKKVEPAIPACRVSTSPIAISGSAHPPVRPIFSRAPGADQLALGYAQTGKFAVGLVLNAKTLEATKRYSNHQNSPLLSVAPVTSAMGQHLEFLESRTASTLQSAVFVPAKKPYAFGLSSGGLAVRHDLHEGDIVVHKPDAATINVPSIVKLGGGLYGAAYRAGGERGDIQLLALDEAGKLQVQPFTLENKSYRLGEPMATSNKGQVMVAFAGTSRDNSTKSLYLATSKTPELPKEATLIRSMKEGLQSPGAVAIEGGYLLEYTEGDISEQRVVAQVLDESLRPTGDPVAVSPSGKDAYDGVIAIVGTHIVVAYLVRSGTSHELWATTLGCEMTQPE